MENVIINGVERSLGLLPTPADTLARMHAEGWMLFSHTRFRAPRPQSEWQESSCRNFFKYKKDQDGEGACFPSGTLVRMADGTEKPIEKIATLDKVLTAEGNVYTVVATSVRSVASGLCRLLVKGSRHLEATGNHPVLTKRGYVAMRDLRRGDEVAMPRYLPCNSAVLQTADHLGAGVRHLASRDRQLRSMGLPGRTKVSPVVHVIPDMIELTPEFGRLLGMFLAEGCTGSTKVTWHFGRHERETLAPETVELVKKTLGADAILSIRPNQCVVVTLHGVNWARLFESLCSKLAGCKHLHPDVAQGPRAFMEAMFYGWLAGDGYRRGMSTLGTSVSHRLAMEMYDIAQALGLRPCIRTCPGVPSGMVKTRQRRWDVEFGKNEHVSRRGYCAELTETHVWRRVVEVLDVPFSGNVFNLEVEHDHSYVAEGIGVHNCVGFSAAHVIEGTYAKQGFDVNPSAASIYAQINGGSDRGANIGDAMTALQSVGCTTLASYADLDWKGAYRDRHSSAFTTEAHKYRLVECVFCSSVADFLDGLQSGEWCGQFGLGAGNNFETDKDGWLPLSGPTAGVNHALCATGGMKQHPTGGWGIEAINSWKDWGDGQFFYCPVNKWLDVSGQELWLSRSVSIPPLASGGDR